MTRIREQMVREALAAAELRAAVPETKGAFRELLGPSSRWAPWDLDRYYQPPKNGKPSQGVSTCGLVAGGLLNRVLRLPWAGYLYWEYPKPYQRKDGSGLDIVSAFSQLGFEIKARLPKGHPPQPGDIICIGSGIATHVLTVVDYDGRTVTSIDGGQVDDAKHGYLQRVRVCRRTWSAMRVVWVLDLEQLEQALGRMPWGAPEWERTVAGKQWGLRQLGRDPGPLDGIWGPRTAKAMGELTEAQLRQAVDWPDL